MGREVPDGFDTPAVLEVGTVKPPQAELSVARALQEQSSYMRIFRISAEDAHTIVRVNFGWLDRLPVDEPNQWWSRMKSEIVKPGQGSGIQRMPSACEHSHR